jgi:hypothetical protein
MTTAGTSIRASQAADQVIKAVKKLEVALQNDPEQFQRFAQRSGKTWPTNPSFEFGLLQPSGLGFKELSTDLVLEVD